MKLIESYMYHGYVTYAKADEIKKMLKNRRLFLLSFLTFSTLVLAAAIARHLIGA